MKSTKIVCTLGPACDDIEIIKEMLKNGMDVARLNASHGTHEEHLKRIETFRRACEEVGRTAGIMLDTKGPEVRVGDYGDEKIHLEDGQKFTLYRDYSAPGSRDGVGISYGSLADRVEAETAILIDDGNIRLEVEEITGEGILCRVVDGGEISTKKRINIPDVDLGMEFLSDEDRSDIAFGIEEGVDFIAASFVRSKEDVEAIRQFAESRGGGEISIISKIENLQGIDNFDEILEVSDGIMVARGDMGVEVDFARLPGIQKMCIDKCNEAGKPVITATQMLESMIDKPTPTRAEITDVANAVFDGTSAVMLSAESAAGRYPALTVDVMSRILSQAEEDLANSPRGELMWTRRREAPNSGHVAEADLSTAIGHAACQAAEDIGARALIAITWSGYTAEMMSRFRPVRPILAITPKETTARKLALAHNVYPVIIEQVDDWDLLIKNAVDSARDCGFLSSGDRVVISAGLPLNVPGNTNTLKVETVE